MNPGLCLVPEGPIESEKGFGPLRNGGRDDFCSCHMQNWRKNNFQANFPHFCVRLLEKIWSRGCQNLVHLWHSPDIWSVKGDATSGPRSLLFQPNFLECRRGSSGSLKWAPFK